MLNYLKKQPLVGLALAIACGYVLAHFAIRMLDDFYIDDFERDPLGSLVTIVSIVLPAWLIYRYRKPLWAFVGRNKWKLSTAALLVAAASIFIAHRLSEAREGNSYLNQIEARDATIKSLQQQHPNAYDHMADEDARKRK